MQAFGATAVPMGLPEMITSLQNGVIDGTMSGISIYVNFNLQTVSKTITETDDTLLVSFGAMSKPWLDKLPADLRKTVVDEARGLQAWAIQQSDDEKVALRAKWIERGGEIVRLPAADMVDLQTRLKPIGADITSRIRTSRLSTKRCWRRPRNIDGLPYAEACDARVHRDLGASA